MMTDPRATGKLGTGPPVDRSFHHDGGRRVRSGPAAVPPRPVQENAAPGEGHGCERDCDGGGAVAQTQPSSGFRPWSGTSSAASSGAAGWGVVPFASRTSSE